MRSGTVIIWIGVGVVVIGLVVRFAPWLVSWFGNLPGDIRIENDTSRVYIPLMSMIVVSIVLTVLANVLFRR